jgi:hypothetical protein
MGAKPFIALVGKLKRAGRFCNAAEPGSFIKAKELNTRQPSGGDGSFLRLLASVSDRRLAQDRREAGRPWGRMNRFDFVCSHGWLEEDFSTEDKMIGRPGFLPPRTEENACGWPAAGEDRGAKEKAA